MALLLDRGTIQSLLNMEDAVQIMEQAFAQLAQCAVDMPQRLTMSDAQRAGWTGFMPARLHGSGAFGVKVVTTFDDNPSKHGEPTTMGTILYMNQETGQVLSIMDGGFITAMRTGAVSGLATKYLARQDASTAGILGVGVQGRTQLEAICAVRRIDSVLCYSSGNVERQKSFVEEMSRLLGVSVRITGSAQEVVEASDVLALATTSQSPVLDGRWLRPGMHINGVGAHTPDARELDTEAVVRSKVVCDYVPSCLAEAGDLIIPIAEGAFNGDMIHAGLGEVVRGDKKGRENSDEITLFKSVGLSIQDVAVAQFVYDKAVQQKVGVNFDFS